MANSDKKILLVEDETELRELYQILLTGEGYQVDAVADGKAGLEAMERGGYDLVLLDIMLPFIDGLDVLERNSKSKSETKQSNSSVVLLTNLAQDQTIAKGLEYGVRGYMVKSDYNPEQLLEAIAEFV
ncbi:response regulator transcription factor [bacterium]|nr:response regulator transcription factor [bacterium]